jgi:hypothetical protein
LIILVTAYRLCLKKKDPFGFVQEVRLMVWFGGVPACICLILNTVLDDSANFKPAILVEIFLVVFCSFQSIFQCVLAIRDFRHEKTALYVCSMALEQFEDSVLNPKGAYHQAFSEHLLSEHAHENLAFVLGVQAWERSYYDAGDRTNKVRARKLMNMYVGDDSILPCNLPDTITQKLKKGLDVAGEGEGSVTLESTFFKAAKDEIINLLHRDALSRFLRTSTFQELFAGTQTGTLGNNAV